jgi:hypothetical protein
VVLDLVQPVGAGGDFGGARRDAGREGPQNGPGMVGMNRGRQPPAGTGGRIGRRARSPCRVACNRS